jgi:CHAT domain-containing protein/Tfp pilus assembly protein PilF
MGKKGKTSQCLHWQGKSVLTLLGFVFFLPWMTFGSIFSLNKTGPINHNLQDISFIQQNRQVECNPVIRGEDIFRVSFVVDQHYKFLVDHWGGGVGVVVYSPTGQAVNKWEFYLNEPTSFTCIATQTGDFKIKASPINDVDGTGNCFLQLQEVRGTTERDHERIQAEKLSADAAALQWQATEVATKEALKKYQQAAALWGTIGDSLEEARALRHMGEIQLGWGNAKEALSFYNLALPLVRKAQDNREEARLSLDMASAYRNLNQYRPSLEFCARGKKLGKEVSDQRLVAQALWTEGEIIYWMGDFEKSIDLSKQALAIWIETNDVRGQAWALQNMGHTYSDLRENTKSFECFNQALKLHTQTSDLRGEAMTLMGLAHLHSKIGEKQDALVLYDQARVLMESIGDRYWEIGILNGIGYLYDDLGDYKNALDYYSRALQLDELLDDKEGKSQDLWNIGKIYSTVGDHHKALEYFQTSLEIARPFTFARLIAHILESLGKTYELLNNNEKALECYTEAYTICQKGGFKKEEADTLNDFGLFYAKNGEIEKADAFCQKALTLNQITQDRFAEASTLINLALLEKQKGNYLQACKYSEAALQISESLREKAPGQELRSSYFASIKSYQELYISLLMEMHDKDGSDQSETAALQANERACARSLLEILKEGRIGIRQGADPALLQRERSLQQLLNTKADRQTKLLSEKHSEVEEATLAREINNLTVEFEQVQALIRSKSPRYAALTQPQPLSVPEIQQKVLDENTLLLEYTLGEERSYLWAVTSTTLHSFTLPKREEIERATRRVRDLLLARQLKPGETPVQYQQRIKNADRQYWQEAAALRQMLLGPATSLLGSKRLLVVADGILQYLPFGALPNPPNRGKELAVGNTSASPESVVPLIVDHEVVNLPSASVMAVLRQETKQRASPPRKVAVLADPVFESDDPRVERKIPVQSKTTPSMPVKASASAVPSPSRQRDFSPATPSLVTSSLNRALRDVGALRDGRNITRLPASRGEARAIMSVAGEGEGLMLLDFKASRASATSPDLGQYRIIHFATHGFLDSEHPELSGLVLSLVDEQGRAQDGFLRLHDIYNLSLPVDLVVLSACNSGLGKEIRGEGLVGIVRGFMYAGAARVVASLWKVEDEATAELMKQFYQQMLHEGQPAAAALRLAQLEMWKQKRWQFPYYWAAFILQGEWN